MVHNCALLNANKPSSSTEMFVFMLQTHLYAKYIHPDGTVFSAFLVVWVVFFFLLMEESFSILVIASLFDGFPAAGALCAKSTPFIDTSVNH